MLRATRALEGDHDPRFERLVRRAAVLCDTPVAWISLVDAEVVHVVASVGMPPGRLSRRQAFCEQVLEAGAAVVAPDARCDDRFGSHPLPGIAEVGFYAGAPLTVEGMNLGALSVLDVVPRRLGEDQLGELLELAEQVSILLELAHYRERERRTAQRYDRLVGSAAVGVWEVEADGTTTFASEPLARMLRTTPAALAGTPFRSHVVSHGGPGAGTIWECAPQSGEAQLRRADGTIAWVRLGTVPATAASRPGGDPGGFTAVVTEISDEKAAWAELAEQQRQLRSLVSNLPGLTYLRDDRPPWTMREISPGCEALTGYRPEELVDAAVVSYSDLVAAEDRQLVADAMSAAVLDGTRYAITYGITHRDGSRRWAWEDGWRREDGCLQGLVLDVTDQVEAEAGREESERRYRHLVEHSPDAILLSQRGVIVYANPAANDLFAPAGELVGEDILRYIHPDDHDAAHAIARTTERHGVDEAPAEYRILTGAGVPLEVEVRCAAVRLDSGPATEVILRDISERVRGERVRVAMQGVFEQIAAGAPLDDTLDVIARMVEDRLPGRRCSIMTIQEGRLRDGAAPGLPDEFRAALDDLVIGPGVGACGTAAWRREPVIVPDLSIDPAWASYVGCAAAAGVAACWSMPISLHDGTLAAVFSVYAAETGQPTRAEWRTLTELRDLTAVAVEHTTSRAALAHGATFDDLTGLPNRRTLRSALREAIGHATADHRVAVLFIDLDDFKDVNDSLGHAAGDDVLRAVAALLKASVRDHDLVARFSGDEFVVCCEGISHAGEVEEIVHRLQATLRRPHRHGDRRLPLRASIGIAVSSGDETPERLLANADAAMYRAKERGDGETAWFDEQLRDQATRRLEIEAALGHAVEVDEIEVHYQPMVDLTTGVVVGAEALARWSRPGLGAVSPAEFITVAESSGLVHALGARVLRHACTEAARWQIERPGQPCRVAVNVSVRQLRNQSFADTVADALAESGLEPALLCLEITESSLVQDDDEAAELLQRLKKLGVTIAIDDFGTGYSSLSYLRRFPLDELKVDRAFVADLDHSAQNDAIVAAVLAVATAIGAGVVAEGVETEAQLAALHDLGCLVAQGFLWSPAVPPEEFLATLRQPFPLHP
jgi:diguanylate cyclase (GGDEF)-like protein/PAS domain S-box-containing protein